MGASCSFVDTVQQDEKAIIERCGEFSHIAPSGFLCIPCPCIIVKAGVVNTRIQELPVKVESKTKDDVTVDLTVVIQYQAETTKIYEAFYRLADPGRQLNSYVFDLVRGVVPLIELDELFSSKATIADSVKSGLTELTNKFGFLIVQTMVTEIVPAKKVSQAMNDIESSKRLRHAALEKAESDKLIIVKRAEGEAEWKRLQGKGVAEQRKAIMQGLQDSVSNFSDAIEGLKPSDIMEVVILNNHFDMLSAVGSSSNATTVFLGHNPAALNQIGKEIRTGFLTA